MPHIIVEHSSNITNSVNVPDLLKVMHDALADQGINKARIKTRAIALDHYIVGNQGTEGEMLHATLFLLEGRDLATKKSYGDPLHAAMKNAVQKKLPNCAITLEIRDMKKETYYL